MNMMYDMRRDGRSENLPEDIDMDMNGSGDFTWGDSDEAPPELLELESDMLEYGQALQAEYANDPRKDVARALEDIWALVAYRNPLKEPQVSHLLDRTGRVAVAEELNSAILCKWSWLDCPWSCLTWMQYHSANHPVLPWRRSMPRQAFCSRLYARTGA